MSKRIQADEIEPGDYIYPGNDSPAREVVLVRTSGDGYRHITYRVGGLMGQMPPLHPQQPVEVEL